MILSNCSSWRQKREEKFLCDIPPSLGELLSMAATRYGDRLAIDLFDRGQKLSFIDWDSKASLLASGLQQLGVRQGMRIGIMLSNTVEFPITWMALARMGAVMVPINPNYTAAELSHVVETADVQFLMLESVSLPQAETIGRLSGRLVLADEPPEASRYCTWTSLLDNGTTAYEPERPVERSDVAVIQFTSGTTGFPKGCAQSHQFWMVSGFNMSGANEVLSTGSILGESPFFYFDALGMLARALVSGAPLYQAERMSVSKAYSRLVETQVEVAYPPFSMKEFGDDGWAHNVKIFITAGSSAAETESVEKIYGSPSRELYGMTEIGVALAVPYTIEDNSIVGSCGYPQPFYELKIVNEDGDEQPPGVQGELWVRGEGVMDGYWNNSEANEIAFVDGWFRTGDIFEKSPQGFFTYRGRIKDMIKRSGENISAVEVESVIASYPDVQAVAVIPVPEKLRGEEVKAVIQLGEECEQGSFDFFAFREFCLNSLAKFKFPRYIEFIDGFDYTPSEKIIKVALKKDDPFSGCWDYQRGEIV